MTVIQELNDKMPKAINTTSPEYQAIFGADPFTPLEPITHSSDYRCGAIANEFEYLRAYVDYLCRSGAVSAFGGDHLDLVVSAFTNLRRFKGEIDESFLNRFYAVVRRQNNTNWSTAWSIIDSFSHLFSKDKLAVIENPPYSNLLQDGDFELDPMAYWVMFQSMTSQYALVTNKKYTGSTGVMIVKGIGGEAYIEQDIVSVPSGANRLVYMQAGTGAVDVIIQRASDSKYWSEFDGSWNVAEYRNQLPSVGDNFQSRGVSFIMDALGDITLTIEVASGTVYLDQLELGPIYPDPSLRLEVSSSGQASSGFMSMWKNGSDPVGGTDYQYASFLDNGFIGGTGVGLNTKVFEDLLQKIKPAGVKADFEIVERNV